MTTSFSPFIFIIHHNVFRKSCVGHQYSYTQYYTRYTKFGNSILEDGSGIITRGLTQQYQRDAQAIVRENLTKWLDGKGRPASWDTLIDVLSTNH